MAQVHESENVQALLHLIILKNCVWPRKHVGSQIEHLGAAAVDIVLHLFGVYVRKTRMEVSVKIAPFKACGSFAVSGHGL